MKPGWKTVEQTLARVTRGRTRVDWPAIARMRARVGGVGPRSAIARERLGTVTARALLRGGRGR